MKVGVCISTTPDRLDLFQSTYTRWESMMPDGAILTYCNDEDKAGVAMAKNLSLEVLEMLGVTHYFIVDNDIWPISKYWWKPYIESGENHLMYQFKMPNKPSSDMRVLYQDEKIIAYSHTRGALLYVNQLVLDTVGGMDTTYKNSFEHPDYTNRIHNAGLTTHRAADVVGSNKLFYCLDQDGKIESSITKSYSQHRNNYEYYKSNRNSKEYKEYRNGK